MLETINDKKLQHTGDNTNVDYYLADVMSAGDYYPFGMQMPGRIYQTGSCSYRYSINGQEKSDELNPNLTTAQFWEYDSRLGRRWNVEPLITKYPNLSGYATLGNNPINTTDPDGQDVILLIWATRGNDAGHTAIAVRNYKTETVMVKGKMQTIHRALNTYTLYELGPAQADLSDNQKHAALTDRLANYGHGLDFNKTYTKEQIIANKGSNGLQVSAYDPHQADGIIQYGNGTSADFKADQKAKDDVNGKEDVGRAYNGVTNNCTSYCVDAIPTVDGETIDAVETINVVTKKVKAATPNKLYREAAKLKNAKLLKKQIPHALIKILYQHFYHHPRRTKVGVEVAKN